ncbi:MULTISPECIES: DUF4349 domain-containing protein [unclassified Nocardiopsis]|uniref:DUF4349 domain-containing protein n=1 Tax=Nocardiopsis TaxID=2013 RepID=UPI00387B0A23
MSNSYDSGAGSDGGGSAPEAAYSEDFAAEAERSEEGVEGVEEQSGGSSVVDPDTEVTDRKLIHTADLTVRVEDVAEAAREAKELAVDAGGHVASESLSTPTGGSPEAYLTLRIPNEGYEDALEELAELGDRSDLHRSVQDVTGEVADVESRIESAETALETLRGYLEEADDVDELLRVEREIQDRQAELEAFQARLKTLEDQTTLSTVNLTLMPPRTYIEEPAEDGIGFLGGLERGWLALVSVFGGLAVAVGWLLPFVAVLALPVTALVWWLRSLLRRRRAAAANAPRVPAHAGAPYPYPAPGTPPPPAPDGTPETDATAGTSEAGGTAEPSATDGTTEADGTSGTDEAAGDAAADEAPETGGTAGGTGTDEATDATDGTAYGTEGDAKDK